MVQKQIKKNKCNHFKIQLDKTENVARSIDRSCLTCSSTTDNAIILVSCNNDKIRWNGMDHILCMWIYIYIYMDHFFGRGKSAIRAELHCWFWQYRFSFWFILPIKFFSVAIVNTKQYANCQVRGGPLLAWVVTLAWIWGGWRFFMCCKTKDFAWSTGPRQ